MTARGAGQGGDPGDGYLLNGLRAWKTERQKEHRMLMARYARLERQAHPCTRAQGKMIDLNRKIIELIDAEIAAAAPSSMADGGRTGDAS